MASLTVRRLGEDLKQRLRLRAARHGRSMEDEARTILGDVTLDEDGKVDLGTAIRRGLTPPRGTSNRNCRARPPPIEHRAACASS